MTPDELSIKRPISIGFVVWVGIICFSLGGTFFTLMGLDQKIIDEVGGLRADWERRNIEVEKHFEQLNSRIDRKVKNHELIEHK